jgi:hypothetical protein
MFDSRGSAEGRLAPIFAAAFLVILALLIDLTLIQTIIPIIPVEALDEHRSAAAPPDPSLLLNSDTAAFAEGLNRWASDRVGFRDLLIQLKNEIDYYVFGISKKVYIGSDGWLFERATTDARFAVEEISDTELGKIEQSFANLAQVLARQGVRLVVVEYPDKSEMYPEHLPINAPHFPEHGQLERIRSFLRGDQDIIFIAAQDLLEPHKRDEDLYYKTDIHVNVIGTVPVVAEIVKRIAAAEGKKDLAWHERFNWHQAYWDYGAESRFLGLGHPVGEEILNAPDFFQVGTDTPQGHWVTNDPRRINYAGLGAYPVFDWEFISRQELCPGKLPGTVLFGNSFSDSYWALGLQNYFCFLRRARTPEVRLKAYVEDIPPGTKYFVLQFLDPYLLGEYPDLGPGLQSGSQREIAPRGL